MIFLINRIRPVLIGLVVLILTAGVAFAAQPAASDSGIATASQSSGKTVPVADEGDAAKDHGKETTEAKDEEKAEASDAADNCTTDPRTLTTQQLADLTHGQIVCWSAHQPTPSGYANHGDWVSSWAKQNHGQQSSNAASGQSKKP